METTTVCDSDYQLFPSTCLCSIHLSHWTFVEGGTPCHLRDSGDSMHVPTLTHTCAAWDVELKEHACTTRLRQLSMKFCFMVQSCAGGCDLRQPLSQKEPGAQVFQWRAYLLMTQPSSHALTDTDRSRLSLHGLWQDRTLNRHGFVWRGSGILSLKEDGVAP